MIRPVIRKVVRSVVRKVTGEDSQVQRYFRELLSSANSFYQSASVSPDTIEMDVYPTNGNAGLPTGAPAVTNNQWQTISFAFTGPISEWGRNGAVYFDGFIANIRPLSSGVDLFNGGGVLDGSNSTGTDGTLTLHNFAAPQVVLYDQVSDGWTGPELLSQSSYTATGIEPTFSYPFGAITLSTDAVYRWQMSVDNMSAGQVYYWVLSPAINADGQYTGDDSPTGTGSGFRIGNVTPNLGAEYSSMTIKRFLKVA